LIKQPNEAKFDPQPEIDRLGQVGAAQVGVVDFHISLHHVPATAGGNCLREPHPDEKSKSLCEWAELGTA